MGRFTVQGAMRYDKAWSYYPEQTVGPVRFFPTALTYPETEGVKGYHDLWPRGGVAVDVFGTGKTSVKVNFGRYLEAAQNGGFFIALNPTGRLQLTTTRAWTDTNRDWVADCDLEPNPAAQSPATTGSVDTCGATPTPISAPPCSTRRSIPTLLSGWGVRPGDWQWGASVQQEAAAPRGGRSRISAPVAGQPEHTDNRARSAADHDRFGVTVPTDSRLPNGGGGTLEQSLQRERGRPGASERQLSDAGEQHRCVLAGCQLDQRQPHGADEERADVTGRHELRCPAERQAAAIREALPETNPPTPGAIRRQFG